MDVPGFMELRFPEDFSEGATKVVQPIGATKGDLWRAIWFFVGHDVTPYRIFRFAGGLCSTPEAAWNTPVYREGEVEDTESRLWDCTSAPDASVTYYTKIQGRPLTEELYF